MSHTGRGGIPLSFCMRGICLHLEQNRKRQEEWDVLLFTLVNQKNPYNQF